VFCVSPSLILQHIFDVLLTCTNHAQVAGAFQVFGEEMKTKLGETAEDFSRGNPLKEGNEAGRVAMGGDKEDAGEYDFM
jgi:hypothetical protein